MKTQDARLEGLRSVYGKLLGAEALVIGLIDSDATAADWRAAGDALAAATAEFQMLRREFVGAALPPRFAVGASAFSAGSGSHGPEMEPDPATGLKIDFADPGASDPEI